MRAVLVLTAAALSLGACGSFSVHEENDGLTPGENKDRYYTQGIRVSAMFPRGEAPSPVRDAAGRLPMYEEEATTQIGFVAGQEIYTPRNIERRTLIGSDRPYAGWLYAGVLIANATPRADEDAAGDTVSTLEIDLGVVGPPSQAEEVHKWSHRLTDSDRPRGWDNQLHFEPGVIATYEIRHRLLAAGWNGGGTGWDVLGKVSGSAGNVLTQAAAGLTGRVGWKLPRDFGVNTIHSTAVEVPDVVREPFRIYLFGGVEGRAVARNIFLDGNTFRRSHDVDREPLVGELRGGIAIEFGDFRLAYTLVDRSREFDEQDDSQPFGSLSLTWTSDF